MNIALWIVLIWLLAGVANVALFWVMACLDGQPLPRPRDVAGITAMISVMGLYGVILTLLELWKAREE